MATAVINGVRLFHDLTRDGPPLGLVHGSWGDCASWDGALPALAQLGLHAQGADSGPLRRTG